MKHRIASWSDGPFAVAVFALAALALGAFAFSQPTESSQARQALYAQTGTFAYEAESSVPVMFDSGRAATGDPVFFRLSERIAFSFDYRFASEATHTLASSGAFVAELSEAGGWKRTLTLQEPANFEGDAASFAGVVELAQLRAMMDAFSAETGVERPQFRLAIYPDIRSNAQVAGESVALAFSPRLAFAIDEASVRPDSETDSGDAAKPVEDGMVPYRVGSAANLGLLWLDLPVRTARMLAVAGLAAAALTGAAVAWARRAGRVAGPFSGREGVVRVGAGSVLAADHNAVEMNSFEDLCAIAEAESTVIFEERWRDGVFVYAVCAHGNTYLWRSAPEGLPARLAEPA